MHSTITTVTKREGVWANVRPHQILFMQTWFVHTLCSYYTVHLLFITLICIVKIQLIDSIAQYNCVALCNSV